MPHRYVLFTLLLLAWWQPGTAQTADSTFRLSAQRYGTVFSAATLPDGHVVVFGDHLYTNGLLTGSLTRFLPGGAFDEPFFQQTGVVDCGPGGAPYNPLVRAYANGSLLLVSQTGSGVSVQSAVAAIVRLLPNGKIDPGFALPSTIKLPSIRTALVQPDGKVLLAGIGNSYSGAPCLLRLNANGSLDGTFSSALITSSTDYVQALALQADGKVLVAGHFAKPSTGLVRLLPTGQQDSSFQPAITAGGIVEEVLCRPNGRILLAGRSTLVVQGQTGGLQQLLPSGLLDPAFKPAAAAGYSLVRSGDNRRLHLLPGGRLCLLPSAPTAGPAAVFLLADGQLDPARPALTNWPLGALTAATPDSVGRLLVSGPFRHRSGTPGNLVRLLATGQIDPAFTPQLYSPGTIYRLVEQAGLGTVLGGVFDKLNGYAVPNLARILPGSTQVDTAFARRVPHFDQVTTLAIYNQTNSLLVSGFYSANEQPRGGVVRLHPNGQLDTLFRRWPAGYTTNCVAVQADGRVLVTGSLGDALSPQGVGRLLANGDHDFSFTLATSLSLGPPVQLLAQPDGRLLLLGSSQSVRVSSTGQYDPSFKPTVLNKSGSLLEDAVLQPNGRITLCGQVPPDATHSRNSVIRLLPNGRRDSTLANILADPVPTMRARTLLYYPDGRLLVGGTSYYSAPATKIELYQFLPDGTPDPAFTGVAGVGDVRALARNSTGQVLAGGYFAYAQSAQQQLSLVALTNSLPLAAARPVAETCSLYPNPAHNELHVHLTATGQPSQLRLLDGLGRVVLTQVAPATSTDFTLTTAGLPIGLYLLHIVHPLLGTTVRRVELE